MVSPTLHGRSILIVEDEPLIALDIGQAFERAGAKSVIASTLRDALVLAEQGDLSGAVLDHALHDGDSSPLCRRLHERKLPFVVYSGESQLEGPCSAGVHVGKPENPNVLVSMLELLIVGPHSE
jgi:DNA-binding response OmpR family regulator